MNLKKIALSIILLFVIFMGGVIASVYIYPPKGVMIFEYHRVNDDTVDTDDYSLSREQFQEQLDYFKENNYHTISMMDFIRAEKYGEEQVLVWRRSYDVAPHALAEDDPRNPRFEVRYNEVPDAELPRTESLKDTIERIMPYWKCVIFPNLKTADELLVVAHGNSLRGIIKHLKGISDEDIVKLNLPTAVPYVFEFDDDLNLTKDYFLGDPEEIKKLMEAVANQGKK